ncbi:MAG: GNAT family N-acetyltransferase [Planctomycetes bacterium]|nr:GNAT family N-acetyltransferase [Planctomycetota bacterium]
MLQKCEVRSFCASDAESLARHANDRRIWIHLRDRFPHPYTHADAKEYIEDTLSDDPQTSFAIVVDGSAAGSIGLRLQGDVERVGAEVGYWLGASYWGRGICTEALRAVTDYALREHDLARLFALPFASNLASHRVLEKAGYVLEGRLRRSAIKDGRIIDQLLYAFVPDSLVGG